MYSKEELAELIVKNPEEYNKILPAEGAQKELMLELAKFNEMMENACNERAPHKVCAYVYDLSNVFNHFYHETRILAEEDENLKSSYISLLKVTKAVLETCIDVLGFSAPDAM